MTLEVDEDTINLKSTKIRSGSHFETAVRIDWDCLKIDPTGISVTSKKDKDPITRAKEAVDI